MGTLDQILARLQNQGDRTRNLRLIGPMEALAQALPAGPLQTAFRASQYIPFGLLPDTIDTGLDAAQDVGRAGTGLALTLAAPLLDQSSQARRAVETAGSQNQDLYQFLRQVNENYAADHPKVAGAFNMITDPTNLLGPLGEATGLVGKAPMLETPARTLLERGGDAVDGVKNLAQALALAHEQGKLAQGIAEAGGQTVQTVYKKGPKAGQTRETFQNLRKSLDFGSAWQNFKQQQVLNPRNLLQDYANGTLWAREAGIPAEEVNHAIEGMVQNARNGALAPKEVLPSRMSQILQDYGWRDKFNPESELGMGFLDANAGTAEKYLAPHVSAALEAGYAAANPLRGGIPIAGVGLAGVKGYYRAYQNAAFSALSHIIQGGFRSVGWEVGFGDELAKQSEQFLRLMPQEYAQRLAALGEARYNRLTALGENMAMYEPSSLFTPGEVDSVLRGRIKGSAKSSAAQRVQLVKDWQSATEAAHAAGGQTAKQIFGDFSAKPTDGARYLDYAIPFLGWAKRAYPKTIEIASNHPTATSLLYNLMQADAQAAQRDGRPAWDVGTLPVDTNTPLVGGPLRLLSHGRDATANVNLLQALSPLPASSLGGGSDQGGGGPMDTLRAALETLGAGFSPMLETAGYAAGMTDKKPRALSKTTGLEAALPGPTLPSLTNGPLNAIRKAEGKAGLGDPVLSVAEELAYEQTGKPLNDPANHALALEVNDKGPLYQQAKAVYEGGGAAKGLLSQVDPFGLTVESQTSADSSKVQAGRPVPPALLDVLRQADPNLAALALRQNNAYDQQNPLAGIYAMPPLTTQEKEDPRLRLWEQQHDNLKVLAPSLYASLRAEFMKANRL